MPDDPIVAPEPDKPAPAGVRVRARGLKQLAAGAVGVAATVAGYVLVGGDRAETATPDPPVVDQPTGSASRSASSDAVEDAAATATGEPTRALAKPKKMWWHNLKSTMCIRDTTDKDLINVTVVDCRAEHEAEVMSRGVLSGPKKWPSDEAMYNLSFEKCKQSFEAYVGVGYDESAYDIDALSPDEEAWMAGDRTVVCLVFDPENETLSRVLRGARE
jgi:hypothetical protein